MFFRFLRAPFHPFAPCSSRAVKDLGSFEAGSKARPTVYTYSDSSIMKKRCAMLTVLFTLLVFLFGSGIVKLNNTDARSTQVALTTSAIEKQPLQTHTGMGPDSYGYVVIEKIGGQQGLGVRSLGSFQCFAASFSLPVKLLQPSFVGSLIFSKLEEGNAHTDVKFGDVFDLEHFNHLSEQESEPTLATWSEFQENAPRDVILLTTNFVGSKKLKNSIQVSGDVQSVHESRQYKLTQQNGKKCLKIENYTNESKLPLCVVRVVNYSIPLDTTQSAPIQDIYGNWDPKQITLIISLWNGRSFLQNPNAILNCTDRAMNRIKERLVPSGKLLRDVEFYAKSYLHSSKDVAIMIRSERTAGRASTQKKGDSATLEKVRDCIQQAVDIAHKHSRKNGIFLTLDIGRYGTITMDRILRNLEHPEDFVELVESTVDLVYGDKLSFQEWENSFIEASGGVDNPAYIAALQRSIASQSKCLIIVGGGNFQMLALDDYLRLHSNPEEQCFHQICVKSRFNPAYQSRLNQ